MCRKLVCYYKVINHYFRFGIRMQTVRCCIMERRATTVIVSMFSACFPFLFFSFFLHSQCFYPKTNNNISMHAHRLFIYSFRCLFFNKLLVWWIFHCVYTFWFFPSILLSLSLCPFGWMSCYCYWPNANWTENTKASPYGNFVDPIQIRTLVKWMISAYFIFTHTQSRNISVQLTTDGKKGMESFATERKEPLVLLLCCDFYA